MGAWHTGRMGPICSIDPGMVERMTGDKLREAREDLGLTRGELAGILRFGANGERRIRRMENDEIEVSGPVSVVMDALLDGWWPEGVPEPSFEGE